MAADCCYSRDNVGMHIGPWVVNKNIILFTYLFIHLYMFLWSSATALRKLLACKSRILTVTPASQQCVRCVYIRESPVKLG